MPKYFYDKDYPLSAGTDSEKGLSGHVVEEHV